MKCAFVTTYKMPDMKPLSGAAYFISKTLQDLGHTVVFAGGVTTHHSFFFRLRRRLYRILGLGDLRDDRDPKILKSWARQIEAQLEKLEGIDFILSPGTLALAHLKTSLPTVMWSDSTFAAYLNYYPEFRGLSQETLWNGHRTERLALGKATIVAHACDWAAQSSHHDYQISQDKIMVLPFGGNLTIYPTAQEVNGWIATKTRSVCNILYYGSDWKRKGGDLVFETAKLLHDQGFPVKLNIVGPSPYSQDNAPEFVTAYGSLFKGNPQQYETLVGLIRDSHFLFLPSKAEAYGMVFCEASAYGVPSISCQTGGITTAVHDGVNGKLFPVDTQAPEYASYIQTQFNDWDGYLKLCHSSFHDYTTRLNWETSIKKLIDRLQELKSRENKSSLTTAA